MTATIAPRPWHAAPLPWRSVAWRFGRAWASPAGAGWSWDLRRDGRPSSGQVVSAILALGVLALLVALAWPLPGMPTFGAFVAVAMLALGGLLLTWVRHAGDREWITLDPRELTVEQHRGATLVRTRLRNAWVRVEPAAGEGSLVELSGEGRVVRVGRHLRPHLRGVLAQELRLALRATRTAGERALNHEPQA